MAVSTKRINKPFTCRLPDDSSIYTADLRAILLALRYVYYSKEKSFLILSAGVALPFRDLRQPTRNITYFASMVRKMRTV